MLLKPLLTASLALLIPHLQRRAEVLAQRSQKKLTERGKKEAAEMKKILEEQRDRILGQQKQTAAIQLSLFATEEQRQIEADRRYWEKRLQAIASELISEPARIEASYTVKAFRIEPVSLVYLYPISG